VENFPTGFFFSVVTLVTRQFGVIGGLLTIAKISVLGRL
jgi:hypothetical protein|tara:strand:- start:380 stop:496 length:117 start_codon:yes stop_codon:yes gene_type:complete